MNFDKRSGCGQVALSDVGRNVHLFGWVDALRDHGDVAERLKALMVDELAPFCGAEGMLDRYRS